MNSNKKSKIQTFNLNNNTKKKANEAIQVGITIIAFMAPWCQHCKELKPTWKDLMNKYKKLSTVTPCSLIESMEGNENYLNVNDNQPSGWPTIRVFSNGVKKGNDYGGGRDMNSLTNFINSEFGLVMSGGRKKRKRRKTRKRKRKKRKKTRKYFFGLF